MGEKRIVTQYRCQNADCDWTDFPPVDLYRGLWLCAGCNGEFPQEAFKVRSVQREVQE